METRIIGLLLVKLTTNISQFKRSLAIWVACAQQKTAGCATQPAVCLELAAPGN